MKEVRTRMGIRVMLFILAAFFGLLAVAQTSVTGESRDRQALIGLGLEHGSAWELYEVLREQAGEGEALSRDSVPDWSGVYSRAAITFDADQPEGVLTSANLTPEYHEMLVEKVELRAQGIEFDPISECGPPGYPRWITEPFLREFSIAPHQTWLINEMVNDIRRIYTDGRGHTAEADRYPIPNGDSIGFWDRDRLVIHTNQLMAGQYNRGLPDYSDQVETVEIWQKVDDRNLHVDVWVYDPPALVEPWYTRHVFTKITDPDGRLRVRYWHCSENQNNVVYETEEGATQFTDFTFTDEDDQ